MLTRRGFAGFASCALCGITEFIATEASAQGAPATTTPGVTRNILSQTDGPAPGYTTILVEATIDAGVPVARHTHPGIESAYCVGGRLRASHRRSSHPHDQAGRWLPNPAEHAPCGRQARERQEQNPHHVCGGEGKAHRLSSLRAHPARGRLLGAMRLMSLF